MFWCVRALGNGRGLVSGLRLLLLTALLPAVVLATTFAPPTSTVTYSPDGGHVMEIQTGRTPTAPGAKTTVPAGATIYAVKDGVRGPALWTIPLALGNGYLAKGGEH